MHEWAELRHFRYLLKIAERQGFRVAAEGLHTSQPNLTVQARQFQKYASVRLFRRLRNGSIRPTETGIAFISLARLLLDTCDEVIDALGAIERGEIRTARFDCCTLVDTNLFRNFCAAHKSILPGYSMGPTLGDTEQPAEEIVSGTVDTALVTLPFTHPELYIEKLSRDPLVVCLRRDDPLAGNNTLQTADLRGNLTTLHYPKQKRGEKAMKKTKSGNRPSIYQTVTDRIISSLKAGVIPWEKPWKAPRFAGGPLPRNFYTNKPYRGINVPLLWSSDHSSPFWLTFKQAQELKGHIRKGETGTPIVFYKQLPEDKKADENKDEDEHALFLLCHYTVFNVEQCDGLSLPEADQPTTASEMEEDELCDGIVTGWTSRPALHLTSPAECRAFYRPSTDSVYMPARNRFVDAPHYYSTLFHELVHSTGHSSRLNRTFGDHFGDELYSKEELVAEMGAAFLCAIAGIANEHTDRNTTAYIQNWISKLEEDNRLVIHAAGNAQRAADCILGDRFEAASEAPQPAEAEELAEVAA